jgi:pectinesterase
MKRNAYILLILLIVLGLSAAEKKKGVLFTVTNPLPVARTMETISIDLKGFTFCHPEWKNEALTVFIAKTELITQSVDNDQDGVDDELIFQASFTPNETRQFELYRKPASPSAAEQKVDVRYVLPREDVGWENDRIAFRVYGSVLAGNVDNGTDVWTKRVRYPIVAKWYKESEGRLPGKDTYHQDRGEGADFFSVGKTLGAGSAGILWNGILVQPGLFSHHRIIANGPLRLIVELIYANMRIDTARYTVIKRITLDAGDQLNRIEETYISNANHPRLTLAAGLVKRSATAIHKDAERRYIALWGQTNADSVNGALGTAVLFPAGGTVSFSEDSLQYLLSTEIVKGKKTIYYSGAAWSRMGDITTSEEWQKYLDSYALRMMHPLTVTIKH